MFIFLQDQGVIEGDAYGVLRYRRAICPQALILADVHVKHAAPLGELPIEIAARDTVERGLADALIVSGTGTGVSTEIADVERVRSACPETPLLIGSGVTPANVRDYLRCANAVIVGTYVKRGGCVTNPVEAARVASLKRAMRTETR